MSQANRLGLINADTKAYGITYDSPAITSESQIRYETCINITGNKKLPEGVQVQTI